VTRALRLRSFFAAAASLAALATLATLWRFRPEWPALPDSLSSPVTTTLLQQVALVAAWLLAALVLLVLLFESMRLIRVRPRLDPVGIALFPTTRDSSRVRNPYGREGILHPLVAEPRLLVVAPREAAPAASEEDIVGGSSRSAASSNTELDERPLISLLGPLTIPGGKRARRGLRARALEVIAFLALRREGAQRDEILEALWPGDDPKRSRHRLYQAVRDARRLLGDVVASERDRYWLDRDRVRVDIDELEVLLGEVSQADGHRRLELLEKALALFRDEPLAGADFPWCEGDVRRFRGAYVELLEEVGRARLKVGDGREALGAAERGLAVDALNESLWRLALEAEGRLGLREAIAARYERLCVLLDERLGLEPAQETRTVYLRLLGPA